VQQTRYPNQQPSDSASDRRSADVAIFHARVDTVIVRNFWRVFAGGVVGFGVCVEVYKHFGILPAPLPPVLIAAAVGIAVALLLPRRRVWAVVEIHRDALRLIDLRKQIEVVPWEQIRLIVGEAGVSLDGGEMLIWKWVRVSTPLQGFKLRLHEQSPSCYAALLRRAQGAVGISYNGDVHLPAKTAATSMATAEHIAVVSAEFNGQARRAASWALASLIAAAVGGTLLVFAWKNAVENDRDPLGRGAVPVVILAALVPVLGGFALKRWIAGRRVIKKLRKASTSQRDPAAPYHLRVASG
jgi:hypothetical protein